MKFISAGRSTLSSHQHVALAAYRHRVFVDRLGWSLPGEPGYEQDQFDREDTVHVLALGEEGEIAGYARLLPTTGAYLLDSVFPHLLDGITPPRSERVWELSRFAAMKPGGSAKRRISRFMSENLLLHVARYCAAQGVETLLAVATLPVERLMQRVGVSMCRLGPPSVGASSPIVAMSIDLNSVTFEALSRFETSNSQPHGHLRIRCSRETKVCTLGEWVAASAA
ncbi:N-acyl-L-homoserine lactone synthetase [Paucibacter oligotrophus]|uniref:Acyl-homoserine-lactone synthase n=1 Tax=Roseateles oligotrophus TaxID=1769250 RepID=A0A840L5Y0_9BURK|nr:acyl-homoserine-lactone synthase [Roseateles oligotrophus]MBB4843201.1 N-acyl-L-homoserine lactone synthetase [Roseateles oligotrophus]